MQGFEALPPWAQALLSIGMFIVTAYVYFSGAFKKLPAPPSDAVKPALPAPSPCAPCGYNQEIAERMLALLKAQEELLDLMAKRLRRIEESM